MQVTSESDEGESSATLFLHTLFIIITSRVLK